MTAMGSNLRAFLIWLAPAMIVGFAVARVSVWVQPHFAPIVVFPLLIGAALGAILCGLVQLTSLNNPRFAVAGTIIVALVAAMAEHGFFFLDRRSQYIAAALQAGVPEDIIEPTTFSEYMRGQAAADAMQIGLWLANALLMAAAAAIMVGWYVKFYGTHPSPRHPHPSPLPEGEGTDDA